MLAAIRAGCTLVVAKLESAGPIRARRPADIADRLVERGVTLALGVTICNPTDPMGKMSFNILASFAEFESDLIRMRTRDGMAVARGKGRAPAGRDPS